jgi:maltooligosyltrehalose synthase
LAAKRRAGPYGESFDIDFDPPDVALRDKVLAPLLGDGRGDCLRRGEVVLRVDPDSGALDAWCNDHRFPIRPDDERHDPATRNPTPGAIHRALTAQLMHFPVYRL